MCWKIAKSCGTAQTCIAEYYKHLANGKDPSGKTVKNIGDKKGIFIV